MEHQRSTVAAVSPSPPPTRDCKKDEVFLPPELWLKIAKNLGNRELSRLSRTDRWRHSLLRNYFFHRNIDDHGTSCLPVIASVGNLELIQTLQHYNNFCADARNGDGDTALLCAINKGHEDVALALIEIGGDLVNLRNPRLNWRPLTLAIAVGRKEVVKKLLHTDGIEVNGERYTDYGKPLFEACKRGDDYLLKLLLACDGIDVSSTDKDGQTGLHVAARKGLPLIADALLDHGKINITAKDNCGQTALSLAIMHGHFEILEVLDAYGVHPSTGDLRQAGVLGEHFSRTLASKDRDLPKQKARCFTITACAAMRGHVALVSHMLPLVDEEEHRDALLLAAAYGHTEIAEQLLKYVRPDFQDERGRTPEWYAQRWKHGQIVRLFEVWGVAQDGHKSRKRKRMSADIGREGQSYSNPIIIDG